MNPSGHDMPIFYSFTKSECKEQEKNNNNISLFDQLIYSEEEVFEQESSILLMEPESKEEVPELSESINEKETPQIRCYPESSPREKKIPR